MFARRIALAMNGAMSLPKPLGSPRLRKVIRVACGPSASHAYVVSMGNGPSLVRITSRLPGASSTISYVYASRRPRKCATNATRDPTASGGEVIHSTDLMLTYQFGAFPGSLAYAETFSMGASIVISVTTSTGISRTSAASVLGFGSAIESPQWRRESSCDDDAERLSKTPGGATYGAIVVTATIAAASTHDDRVWAILAKTAATLVVFWLAHLHSAIIASRFDDPDEPLRGVVWDCVVHDLPMLEVGLVPFAALACGAIGLVDAAVAVRAAMIIGVGELFAVGVARARRSELDWVRSSAMGALYAAVGGALVALKVAIH